MRSAPPVLCPQVPESGDTPIFSRGLFAGWAGSTGPAVGDQRTDGSVQSNSLEGSERARAQSRPPYGGIAPLLRRVQGLESKVGPLEDSLLQSFALVRDELDEVWRDLGDLCKSASSPFPWATVTPPLFQGRPVNTAPSSSTSILSPASFQHLMRQVVDELCTAGFILRKDPGALDNSRLRTDALDQIVDQISALSRRLVGIEKELKDPDGTIAKLKARIKTLEDQRGGDTIKRGGKTFHNVITVNAWVQTFQDKDLYRYCIDMVTLIMLCAEPYDTIAEGMASAAAAHKAEYNSLTEAHISLSYGLT